MSGKGEIKIINDNDSQVEFVRIHGNVIRLGLQILTGKSGDSFIVYAPSFDASGYGDTKDEAFESFKLSLDLFCEDILNLKREFQEIELAKLGWKQEKFKKKNFSKVYINSDGVLRNFDPGTVVSEYMEMAV